MSITNFRLPVRGRSRGRRGSLLLAVLLGFLPLGVGAQQPTPQQQNAIRNACRGDFQANCAGVPTGGSEALQCLKQNYAKESPACQKALAPVMGGASPSASGGAPGSAPATAPTPPSAPASPPAAAAGGQGPMGGGQPASMREELMLTREMCGNEFRSYCANVQLGGGRGMQCLEANAANLSPRCKVALAEIRARR